MYSLKSSTVKLAVTIYIYIDLACDSLAVHGERNQIYRNFWDSWDYLLSCIIAFRSYKLLNNSTCHQQVVPLKGR